MSRFTYNHITVGGTFDRLHAGHQSLLTKAFLLAKHVTVAVTADSYKHTKQFSSSLLPYSERVRQLHALLSERSWSDRATIAMLTDFYGPSLTDDSMDAIVITKETRHHAVLINKKRIEKHMKPLKLIIMPFVKSSDMKIIRSSRIRGGEIDRQGMLYRGLFGHIAKSLPTSLRTSLRKPLGIVIPGTQADTKHTALAAINRIKAYKDSLVIAVGDIVTSSLKSAGYTPHIAVIDYRNHRENLPGKAIASEDKRYINYAGTIMPRPVSFLYRTIRSATVSSAPKTIVINGEEDLLAFPAILMAPLRSLVLYGQYNKGIVLVEVTEEIKKKVSKLLREFQ
ncbi:MAG: hypothetical protein RI947_254 [Candidatus Parcubacteria bacterium]|jgi:pantetheine-phosphate adenylyltransferase